MKPTESESSSDVGQSESECGAGSAGPGITATPSDLKATAAGDGAADKETRETARKKGGAAKRSAKRAKGKVSTASISKGTVHRPKISHPRWQALELLAVRRGVRINVVLNEAIDRTIGTKRRGVGAQTSVLRNAEILLHASVLDLIRYEKHLDELVTGVSTHIAAGTIRDAEALDFLESMLRALLEATASLRSDMFGALRILRAESEQRRQRGR